MRKIIFIVSLLAAILLVGSCSQSPKKIKCEITGKMDLNELNENPVIIEEFWNGEVTASDTAIVHNNTFKLEVKFDSTTIRRVYIPGSKIRSFEIVLETDEKGKSYPVTISIDKNEHVIVAGSPLNEELQKRYENETTFRKNVMVLESQKDILKAEGNLTLQEEYEFENKVMNLIYENIDNSIDFCEKNINNPVGEYYFYKLFIMQGAERQERMKAFASERIKKNFKWN